MNLGEFLKNVALASIPRFSSSKPALNNFSLQSIPRSAPVIAAFGDSTLAYMSQFTVTCTSLVNNFNGTATITFSGSQGIVVGDDIGVQGAQNEGFKVLSAKVLAVSGNAYTYPITGNPPASDGATPTAIIRYPYRGSSAGPLAWTNAFLGCKLNIINAAQVGDTTTKLLARFDQDIAPLMPDRVAFTAGVNDAWAATSAPTLITVLATMKSNTLAILAKCKAIGAKFDIITGFPQPANRNNWSTFGRDCFVQYRKWLVQLAKSEELFCMVWGDASAGSSQVQNATDVDGAPNAGMINADKIHPLSTACYIAGKRYAQFLSTYYSLPMSPGNIRAITDSGLFLGTTFSGIFTGTAGTKGAGVNGTGPLATGLTVTISTGTPAVDFAQTARTVTADGDTAGNWQAVTMTATAAGDKVTVAFPNLVTQLANGDVVDIKGLARVLTGATLCKDVSLSFVSQTATAGNLNVTNLLGSTAQQGSFPESFAITLGADAPVRASYNGYSPGAPTNFIPLLSFTASAAGIIILELACWSADKLSPVS